MELIASGIAEGLEKLVTLDRDVLAAAATSLGVSGAATAFSIVVGIPLGAALGLTRFRSRNLVLSVVNTGMGLPPVAVGLFVAVLVWRSGPLGQLDWYCTREAMVLAQLILALPVVIGLTAVAFQSVDPLLRMQLLSLGASPAQLTWILVGETRLLLVGAAIAGFGTVIGEIGASLMVGCNIKGDTRILTTGIALETSKGEFGSAFALTFVLLLLMFAITAITTWAQQRSSPA